MPFAFILFGISFLTLKTAAKVPGLPDLDLLLAQRTLFLPSAQRICNQSLGVPQDSPEVDQARQTILAACKAHNVACGIPALTKADAAKRLKQGWKMI
jgi:hypothetical protein